MGGGVHRCKYRSAFMLGGDTPSPPGSPPDQVGALYVSEGIRHPLREPLQIKRVAVLDGHRLSGPACEEERKRGVSGTYG